jgi:hypothetical protein
MSASGSSLQRLRKLVKDDPRSAILLHELLGPPPGLRRSTRPTARAEEDQ